jgi:hypothetical protein
VITGFNTDIEFNGVTYHVQTEDKGLDSPLILSLVYESGTILASKRTSYKDLLGDEFDKSVLTGRLQRQHKLICAAIHAGRIEDLKAMTNLKKVSKKSPKDTKEVPKVVKTAPLVVERDVLEIEIPSVPKPEKPLEEKVEAVKAEDEWEDIPIEAPVESLKVEVVSPSEQAVWDLPIIEGAEILAEDEIVLSASSVEIISEIIEIEGIIREELKISFLENYSFTSGKKEEISVEVFRGDGAEPLVGANVMVKVLGADFRPMIFHTKTNNKGIATVSLKLPNFRSGRAAILARAIDNDEEAEIRKVISHK